MSRRTFFQSISFFSFRSKKPAGKALNGKPSFCIFALLAFALKAIFTFHAEKAFPEV
jgi:hypothetical protein